MQKFKLSKYNFFVPQNERIIFHNLLSGSLFTLEKSIFDELEPLLSNLDLLIKHSEPIFSMLFKTGFIVESDFDEIDLLRFNYIKEVSSNPLFKLIINPTLECNFACWYCYQNHPKGYMISTIQNRIKEMTKKLIDSKQYSGINLGWFGGEPLLYFDQVIYPLSKHISSIIENKDLIFYNSAKVKFKVLELLSYNNNL